MKDGIRMVHCLLVLAIDNWKDLVANMENSKGDYSIEIAFTNQRISDIEYVLNLIEDLCGIKYIPYTPHVKSKTVESKTVEGKTGVHFDSVIYDDAVLEPTDTGIHGMHFTKEGFVVDYIADNSMFKRYLFDIENSKDIKIRRNNGKGRDVHNDSTLQGEADIHS